MAPRPRWWHQLQASKNEAILAIDLYNRSGKERQLEAFIVHMSLAWLRLFQSKIEKDGGDLYVRTRNNRRIKEKNGDWRMKPLSALIEQLLAPNDPRKANLEFFTELRHRVEHRYERDIAALVAGKTQAHLLNYENLLVEWFGENESVASELRFPLFVSSITDDAVKAVKEVAKRVPKAVRAWVHDYDTALDPNIAADQSFDFRIYLIPQTGPKTAADAAMTFVRLEDLNDEQREVMDRAQTIIREKKIPVSNLDRLKPGEVRAKVDAALGRAFTMSHHTNAWRHYGVRPPTGDPNPEATRADFCVWDSTFRQHVYTQSWVDFLIRELSDAAKFEEVCLGTSRGGAAARAL